MRLAHLHLPNTTPFARVSSLQQALTTRFLAHKKLASPASILSQTDLKTNLPGNAHPPPPDPTIITFSPNPVYTTGRRDLPPSNTCPNSPTNHLSLPPPLEPIRSILTPSGANAPLAEYHPTLRGGQTTYHGPGQMVAYTILDLRRLGLTPRCHIRVLENSVIDVLKRYGVNGFTTADPGVWVQDPASAGTAKKITAVGVHLRRNISSFGIGLNVTEEPMWFFKQIVACGLEGKEATSLEGVGVHGVGVDDVASEFVERFVERINRDFACGEKNGEKIEEIYQVQEEDLLRSL
ncbi:Octanoyltransferase [Penicillium lividum]|nr:Octanoyltransferase [Penicillium lividum]